MIKPMIYLQKEYYFLGGIYESGLSTAESSL